MNMDYKEEVRVVKELHIPWSLDVLKGKLFSAQLSEGMSADFLIKEGDINNLCLVVESDEGQRLAWSIFSDSPGIKIETLMGKFPTGFEVMGDTPMHLVIQIFDALKRGEDVLTTQTSERPCGFLPAILSILSDPQVVIAKVLYPIEQRGYELSTGQRGYLYGLSDAMKNSSFIKMIAGLSGFCSPE